MGDRADVTRTESVTFAVRGPTVVQATTPAAAPPRRPSASPHDLGPLWRGQLVSVET